MSHVIRDLASQLPVPEAGIASSPLLDLPGATKLVLFALDAGQEISPHAAPFPAQVLVLDGRLEVMVGTEWETLEAHDGLDLPAGIPHAVRAKTPGHFLLTMLRGVKEPAAAAEPAAGCSSCGTGAGHGTNLDLAPLPVRDEASYRVASPVLRQWMREHDEALRRLALLDKSARVGDWGPVAAVATWLYDELKVHNEAEEQHLFPLMDPCFGGGHGPTECMRAEHRQIWANTLALQENLKTGVPADPARATQLALAIAGELGAHIDKENNVLYPMAERLLNPAQLKALEEGFFAAAR